MERAKALILNEMPGAEVEVTDLTGTGDHVGLQVTSALFQGKRLIQQHQMIMDILKGEFAQELHAVQIKTIVKKESPL